MFSFTPQDVYAIWLSAKVAVAATIFSVPFGFAIAYLLVFVRFRGKAFFEGMVNLPLVLPPVVVGYLLLIFFGQAGVGPLLLKITSSSMKIGSVNRRLKKLS